MTNDAVKAQLEYYLQAITQKKGKHYVCPSCKSGTGPKRTPAGSVTNDGQAFHCFSCGFHGDIYDVVGVVENIHDKKERFRRVHEIFGISASRPATQNALSAKSATSSPNAPRGATAPSEKHDYTEYYLKAQEALKSDSGALAYLRSRGISPTTAQRFAIGYDGAWRSPKALREGKQPPPSRRLIIPTGKYSYLARAIDQGIDPAYRAMKEGPICQFNPGALRGQAPVFVTEGEIDALSVIEAGHEAIGLGSTANIKKFAELCKSIKNPAPVILSLDNDEAGRRAQAELEDALKTLGMTVYTADISAPYKDPNEHLQTAPEAFKRAIDDACLSLAVLADKKRAEELESYQKNSAYSFIQSFINGIADSVNTPYIPTGFQKLDAALDGGLYEGLYIVGAITSLGKTTFALQAADNIAQNGDDVLIFSLEMARTELMSKSISRETFLLSTNTSDAKTARGITTGKRYGNYREAEKELIKQAITEYAGYAGNIFISEGLGDIGVQNIREAVKKHISVTGKKPVVIIDYLQLLAPYEPRFSDKQNTDKAVLELKRISRDFKLPVIAISSFNRQNYSQSVTMEAFKESGAIEYSSDVLIGLQARGAGSANFDINEAKKKDPREIELKILKNRNGATGGVIGYSYYPLFNYFREA